MSDRIIEQIVNIKEEIRDIAALKNHTHEDLIKTSNIITDDDSLEDNAQSTTKIASIKSLVEYINTQLQEYFTIADAESQKETIEEDISDTLANYVTTEDFNTELSHVTTNFEGHSFKYPQETTKTINNIIEPGYYQYTGGNESFQCDPYMVNYGNSLIRVEKQGDHLIQYVHSTTETNNGLQIDGREYIRHGYLTNNNSGDTITNWSAWRVHHFPYQQKDDLLAEKGKNIDDNAFHVYESTAGYTFEWKQKSTNAKYVLPMDQYTYEDVYILNKELPIQQPMIFSNYIGHIDVKIVNEPNNSGDIVTKIKVRSSNNKGEYVVGVDNAYFVPRTN